jgi:hypothetical protein
VRLEQRQLLQDRLEQLAQLEILETRDQRGQLDQRQLLQDRLEQLEILDQQLLDLLEQLVRLDLLSTI